MAPTLAQARRRRWWIACTAVLENLMFAAVLLGWSSLLLMLKKEGFYSNLCVEGAGNLTIGNLTAISTRETPRQEVSTALATEATSQQMEFEYPTCSEQDEILNRYFSIGSSLLSAVTVILGVIMDKYGCRMMRLCGCWTFMISCVCFAVGSLDTENLSFLIAPGVCLNGMGGIVYVFTSFQIPNLFENIRSTMISLMIGSYSASAILYMIFKAAYDAGVPFAWLMMIHAVIGFFTFINCYMNTPGDPIPGPDDITYAIKFKFGDLKFDHKISGKQFLQHSASVGRRMSTQDHGTDESILDMSGDKNENILPFWRVLITPCVLWSFVMMCLTQLRLIAYMGWLEMYLKASANLNNLNEEEEERTVETYTFLFGLLQINCFFMAPVIGTVMDWKLKKFIGDEKYKGRTRKGQLVRNLALAFFVTNILMILFGIIVLFEKHMPLQIVSFVLHTAIRTFLHSSTGGLYACMYHFSHFGKLTGIASFLSAVFILVQDPLFVFINSSLGGDPFWVNFALLILSIFSFGLPAYLWYYLKNYEKELADTQEPEKNGSLLPAIPEEDGEDIPMVESGVKIANGRVKDLADEQEVHLSISAITF